MKKEDEKIIFKSDVEEENIQRVDKRPGSVFSILLFAMLFLVVYLLYPQLTMLIPFPGTELNVSTNYQATGINEMLNAETIVVATLKEKNKAQSYVSSNGEPIVFQKSDFQVSEVIKGDNVEEISVAEYGGSALFTVNGKKQKYTVKYENAAQFEKDTVYLLFIKNGEVINGRAGALKQNEDGKFTDVKNQVYTIEQIRDALKEAQQ